MRRILMVMLLAGTVSACASVSRFEKDAVTAHGEKIDGSREPLYYSILIDLGNAIDSSTLNIQLKLRPDAPPIPLSELHPEVVAKYLPRFTLPPQWPEKWKKKAREQDAYTGGGFHIIFKKNSIISIGICSHCAGGREHPTIGTPDGHAFYALPLTEQQLIEVFGPPKRIYKVNEVRY